MTTLDELAKLEAAFAVACAAYKAAAAALKRSRSAKNAKALSAASATLGPLADTCRETRDRIGVLTRRAEREERAAKSREVKARQFDLFAA